LVALAFSGFSLRRHSGEEGARAGGQHAT
jgi:hypothetical protein